MLLYQLKDGKVCIVVPSIRFGEESDSLPEIRITNDGQCVYQSSLGYYGDTCCITSNKAEIDIDAIGFNNMKQLAIEAEISCNGVTIYHSKKRLHRNAIVFNAHGAEITKRPGDGEVIHLYATQWADIDGRLENAHQCVAMTSKAQLFRVMISKETQVIVNGTNLFPTVIKSGEVRVEVVTQKIDHAVYMQNGNECEVYNDSPVLVICVPKDHAKQYHAIEDGKQQPISMYAEHDGETFSVKLPGGELSHIFQLTDILNNTVVYSLHYVVFENLELNFDGYSSLLDSQVCEVIVRDKTEEQRYFGENNIGESVFRVPYRHGELCFDLPTLDCRLNGNTLTTGRPIKVWIGDVPMSSVLEITSPRGYKTTILIGARELEETRIELGNIIREYRFGSDTEPIIVRTTRNGIDFREEKLFDIVTKTHFDRPPLSIREGQLLWNIEGNYFGDTKNKLHVEISRSGCALSGYSLGYMNTIIEEKHQLPEGVYEYCVTAQSGYFSMPEIVFQGRLIVGDEEAMRFYKQAVMVTEAIVEDERLLLNEEAGVITDLEYLGIVSLNGEDLPYPCFEGCLKYLDSGGILAPYADRDYVGKHDRIWREQVNPVKLWMINEHTISLRSPDDGGLYINRDLQSITDRTPDRISKRNYDNPDYYLYTTIEEDSYVQPN